MRRGVGLAAVAAAVVLGTGCAEMQGGSSSSAPDTSAPAAEAAREHARAADGAIASTSRGPDEPSTTTRSPSSASSAGSTGERSGSPAASDPGATGTPAPSASGRSSASASPNPSTTTGGEADEETPENLERGHEGPRVRTLQRTLRRLHYDPGAVDGVFGGATQYAVWAFQKVHGLNADGIVGPKTREALRDPEHPEPLVPGGDDDRVEIDLSRQLLYVYDGGQLALISHISSGSQEAYCTEDGHCGDAVTPTGDYDTTWRVDGWRTSDLGRLYNPVYFVGGIAVHGYPSVPRYPASHGCVRIPMHTAETFPELVGDGEPVHVRSP